MLVKFHKHVTTHTPNSIGLVLHDTRSAMPLVRGSVVYTHNTICQDLWVLSTRFKRIPHNKVNLRAFAKQISKLDKAQSNCKPFHL